MALMNLLVLQTEQNNAKTTNIDTASTLQLCEIINQEDDTVAKAVKICLPQIATAIDLVVSHVSQGGRVVYTGAGTSGRLGILDASEIPPTFSSPSGQFVGLIAGGDSAIRTAVENAEDSPEMGSADLKSLSPPLSKNDVVIGIASSGRTPYVIGALNHARVVGAASVGLACVCPSGLRAHCDISIECVTGPEVITGSTRMKAGTATKMILNMISTGAQIRMGKTFGNLMVDLRMSNEKLRDRARRVILSAVPQTSVLDVRKEGVIEDILEQCNGQVKLSILVAMLGCSPEEGHSRLQESSCSLRRALEKTAGNH